MNTPSSNTIELTSKQYLYFREELFRRATPWEKRSIFAYLFDEMTVEDRGSCLRFRLMTMRRYYPVWDVQVIRTTGHTRVEWSDPKLPWWIRVQMFLVLPFLGLMGINLYHQTRQTPGPGNGSLLLFLVGAFVTALGIFAFAEYQREEGARQLNALLSEAASAACLRSVAESSSTVE